jgi:hypothetical protein
MIPEQEEETLNLNMILEQEEETLDLNMIPKQVLPPS